MIWKTAHNYLITSRRPFFPTQAYRMQRHWYSATWSFIVPNYRLADTMYLSRSPSHRSRRGSDAESRRDEQITLAENSN